MRFSAEDVLTVILYRATGDAAEDGRVWPIRAGHYRAARVALGHIEGSFNIDITDELEEARKFFLKINLNKEGSK